MIPHEVKDRKMLIWEAVLSLAVKIQNSPRGSCWHFRCGSFAVLASVALSQHSEFDTTDAISVFIKMETEMK